VSVNNIATTAGTCINIRRSGYLEHASSSGDPATSN